MIVERTRMEAGDVQCRRQFSGVPARYALAFMFFLGFVTSLFLRVTLSVAIIEMKARRNRDPKFIRRRFEFARRIERIRLGFEDER